MRKITCLQFLLCLCHVYKSFSQVSNSSILRIELRIQDSKVLYLIADSLQCNNDYLTPYFDYSHVSFDDLKELIGTRNITIREALNALNLKLDNLYSITTSQNALIDIVKKSNLNLHQLYDNFVKYFLTEPMTDVPKILKSLKINENEFATAVVFGTDKEMLEIASRGSYDMKNVRDALNVVNKNATLRTLFDFIYSSRLNEAYANTKNLTSTISLITAFKRTLTAESIVNFFQISRLTYNDFYTNKAFNDILSNVVDTKEVFVGVAVSNKTVVTNCDSLTVLNYKILRNYTKLVGKLVEVPSVEYGMREVEVNSKQNVLILTPDADLKIVQELSFPNVTESENLKNCVYFSVSELGDSICMVPTTPIMGPNFLTIKKTDDVVFHIGSPLICGKYLYGVADWEFASTVTFMPVYRFEDQSLETHEMQYNVNYLTLALDFFKEIPVVILNQLCNLFRIFKIDVCSIFCFVYA